LLVQLRWLLPTAEDIMSALRTILEGKDPTVHYVTPEATVLAAVDRMCRARVGSLLVEVNDEPIGILTERDIMARLVLEQRDPATTHVAEIMSRDVLCIDPDREPEEAMALMTERRVRHLPVVYDGTVIGIISMGDLVRWASRNQEFEARVLRDYVIGVYPG
jgi:CBS domain-containing protein